MSQNEDPLRGTDNFGKYGDERDAVRDGQSVRITLGTRFSYIVRKMTEQ